MSFKDKTFCASPGCKNKCGRKMTDKELKELEKLNETGFGIVSKAYFCGEPEREKK